MAIMSATSALKKVAAALSRPGHRVTGHFVEVSFDDVPDPEERQYFKHMRTSFKLSDEEVDQLREAGRRLLRRSPEFQKLLDELR